MTDKEKAFKAVLLHIESLVDGVQPGFEGVILPMIKSYCEAAMATLLNCTCDYPKHVFRNGSGHNPSCPVQTEWQMSMEERRANA